MRKDSIRSQRARENYLKAKELVAVGTKLSEACKQAHISSVTWYKLKKREEGKSKEIKPVKTHKFVDLEASPPPQETDGNVAIVVCKPGQLKNVLNSLTQKG